MWLFTLSVLAWRLSGYFDDISRKCRRNIVDISIKRFRHFLSDHATKSVFFINYFIKILYCKFDVYFQITILNGIINCKVNVLQPLFIKFSAIDLHQDIRNNLFN